MKRGAWHKTAELVIDDAIEAIKAALEGSPYTSTIVWSKSKYHIMECLADHTYCIDAGIGGINVSYKKGDIEEFGEDLSINAMDRKMWKLLRVEER